MPLGIYISVPFCRSKCSFCNFASDVFSRERMQSYVERVCDSMKRAEAFAQEEKLVLERAVDSVYLGGGTPSILAPDQLRRLFQGVRESFTLTDDAEITVECAPGTLTDELIKTLLECGVNRVSLGVQSFVDQESKSVGRLHSRAIVLDDLKRLRAAGLTNINIDLIAGLPYQTIASWERSLADVVATGVPHVSVYMLEVDDDSRLGRELLAGGQRYHAHHVPDSDLQATMYERACEELESAGIHQYEISNFAREGFTSRHNLKYWTRAPYLGFGVDAHSMLAPIPEFKQQGVDAVRFGTPATLEEFAAWDGALRPALVNDLGALEEKFFLGLRLNAGIELRGIAKGAPKEIRDLIDQNVLDVLESGLVALRHGQLQLTPSGRLLSNEVFERFINMGVQDDLRERLGIDPDERLPGSLPSSKVQ